MAPTGRAVFLFSDVEGSTARWESHREAMADALRRHDAILQRTIEAHRGHVFKRMGDAFCAAFAQAGDAIDAAADIQRSLREQDFEAVHGLRVRIALHAGDAEERDGDYFGPALNRVARLLSTGHGEQILVSGPVADAAGPGLAPGVSLRALGTHRLKDLDEPERVFQLVAPGLPLDFPPLRSLESVANNLPRQATRFIGRGEDVAEVLALLKEAPLVTVAGTGGVGKTRVALQAAAESLDRFPDGVWFLDLAPVSDGSLIAGTALRCMGVAQSADAPVADLLLAQLKTSKTLLVFDNCEHLIADAASLAVAVIAQCPNVAILATSRERLNVPQERVYRLPSLGLEESVALFADRASAVSPAFSLSGANRGIVEDICRRLDGIALAIELAAPRVRIMPLEELRSRLDDRFRLLTGGNRAALPRQQTMRALVDWSYGLLGDEEKRLFRQAGIFSGGFTAQAAAGVCGEACDEFSVLDTLGQLVDKSLIVANVETDGARFRMLQSIREYACDRAKEAGETPQLHAHHAAYFDRFADALYAEWDTEPRPTWLLRAGAEIDNLRDALRWAVTERNDLALGIRLAANAFPIFLRLSLLREGIERCAEAAAASEAADTRSLARLHYGLSMLYNNQGALAKALDAALRAVALYENSGDARGHARALSQAAQQLSRNDRNAEARPYAERALDAARQLGDARLLANALQRCGVVYESDDIEKARALFEESVTLYRGLGRAEDTTRALIWWADAEAEAGCLERANDLLLEALELDTGDTRMYLTMHVACFSYLLGEYDRGRRIAREALEEAVKIRHPVALPSVLLYLAALDASTTPERSARLFGYTRAQFEALEWPPAPHELRLREQLLRSLQTQLREADFDRYVAEGATWHEDDALQAVHV